MKLHSMAILCPVKRSTLVDANEAHNRHIWEELATLLIWRTYKLYYKDSFDVDPTNTINALDATTIDFCLLLFTWKPLHINRAAARLHPLPFEAMALYVMDRGYLDFSHLSCCINRVRSS